MNELNKVNALIEVNYDSDRPTVSGRELHEALEIKTPYKKWFDRMCEYGFAEGTDFFTIWGKSTGGRPATDHQLTIHMAKMICMLQRTEKGKVIRKYFASVEEAWNSPESIMERALQIAQNNLARIKAQCMEMKPKANYYNGHENK